MISVGNLIYDYPGNRALKGVSFDIAPGSITALVGPNGAGKTTLLRCVAALETPLAGSIELDGIDVIERPREAHRRVGYLQDFFGLYGELTVRRCLTYFSAIHGRRAEDPEALVQAIAEPLDLVRLLDARAGDLSRGQRQRVAIAQAIVHGPRILLLDEPAAGLDPQARRDLSQLLVRLRERGLTIVVSSHILTELEDYSSDVMIMDRGRVVEHLPVAEHRATGRIIEITLAAPVDQLADRLAVYEGIEPVSVADSCAEIRFGGDGQAQHELLRAMIAEGLPVAAFAARDATMQDLYAARVERSED